MSKNQNGSGNSPTGVVRRHLGLPDPFACRKIESRRNKVSSARHHRGTKRFLRESWLDCSALAGLVVIW